MSVPEISRSTHVAAPQPEPQKAQGEDAEKVASAVSRVFQADKKKPEDLTWEEVEKWSCPVGATGSRTCGY